MICTLLHVPIILLSQSTLTEFINCIESVIFSYPGSTIVIVGDFNQLDMSRLITDYHLLQYVATATHNLNLTDKMFVNQPHVSGL